MPFSLSQPVLCQVPEVPAHTWPGICTTDAQPRDESHLTGTQQADWELKTKNLAEVNWIKWIFSQQNASVTTVHVGIPGRPTPVPFPWLGSTSHTCVKVRTRITHPWLSILTLNPTGILCWRVFFSLGWLRAADLTGKGTPSSVLLSPSIWLQKVSKSPKPGFKYREGNKTSLTNWQLFLSENHRAWQGRLYHPGEKVHLISAQLIWQPIEQTHHLCNRPKED